MFMHAVSPILGNHPLSVNIYLVNPCTSFLRPQVENLTPQQGGEYLEAPWELIAPPQDCQEVLQKAFGMMGDRLPQGSYNIIWMG